MSGYLPESLMGRRDLFALFYRRKWVVIVTFVLSLGIHCGIVFFRPAMFEVTCHAELRNPEPAKYGLEDLPGASTLATARGDLVRDLIRSDEFEEIVQKDLDARFVHLGRAWDPENLFIHPDPNGGALLVRYESSFESTQPVLLAAKRAVDEVLQRSFSSNIAAVRTSLDSRVEAERSAFRERHEQLTRALAEVGLPPSLDPAKRHAELTAAITTLEGERAAARVELEQLQATIAGTDPGSGRPPLDELEGSPAFTTIQGLAQNLIDKEVEVLRLKSTHTDAHPAVKAASLQLEQERRVYHAAFEEGSPFYPEIAAALQRKRSRIASEQLILATQIAALEAKLDEYERLDREYHDTLSKIDQHGDSLRTLALQRNATQQTLDELSDSLRRLSTFEKVEAPILGLLSQPSPPERTTARLRELLGVAVLLAMVFSFGVGYVMESVDHRIHDVHVLKRLTDVPLLGAVPTASASAASIPPPGDAPSHPEAFNSILQKLLANLEADHRVVVISGPDINAGKSYVSANLAIAAGRLGLRTLLVDADLRQPRMFNTFGVSRFPGLSGWLDGTERGHRETLFRTVELAADGRTSLRVRPESVPRLQPSGVGLLVPANADAGCVIQRSGHTALSLITSGREVPNPGLLLQSERMGEFVRWARASFDLCFIDSPPLRQVADTLLVASHADASILVTRAGHTSGQDLKWACDSLREVDSLIAGTILNGVLAPSGRQY